MSDPSQLAPHARIDEDGVWVQILSAAAAASRPGLFLDRDGVVVEDVGFLHRPDHVRMLSGAAETIAAANARGVLVAIVTNQSGVGRGLFDWADFAAVQAVIMDRLAAAGARIDAVLACPHHREARPPHRHPDHPARKPNPGMILTAARLLRIDLAASWIVGDRARDLTAGRKAGLAGGLLVGDGETAGAAAVDLAALLAEPGFAVIRGSSIKDALRLPLFADGRAGGG